MIWVMRSLLVLIQDIKQLLHQINVTVSHALREGKQRANFMAKLESYSDVDLLLYESPPTALMNLLISNVDDTLFLWE